MLETDNTTRASSLNTIGVHSFLNSAGHILFLHATHIPSTAPRTRAAAKDYTAQLYHSPCVSSLGARKVLQSNTPVLRSRTHGCSADLHLDVHNQKRDGQSCA